MIAAVSGLASLLDNHLLKRQGLIEVGCGPGVTLYSVGFVSGPVLCLDSLSGVHEIGGQNAGYLADLVHPAVDQQNAGNAAGVVESAGNVVVEERSAAVDADDINEAEAAEVVAVGVGRNDVLDLSEAPSESIAVWRA